MKKVIIAICILLVIVVAGILESVYVHKLFTQLDVKLAELERSIEGEDDVAKAQLADLSAWWEKRRSFLELFVYSPDLRSFSVALGEADGSLKCDDYQNALSKIQSLIVMSSNIHRVLDFNLADII